MRVAFIGIGNMGWPMAANVRKAGHDVIVYDLDGERTARFISEHGGTRAASLAELSPAQFVVTMLPTGHVVREIYLDEGLAGHLQRDTIAIDMSSSDPTGTRALGPELAKFGVTLLDAPVSGAVPRARTGTLAIMIGGDDADAIERAKPLLSSMGNRLFETGPLGSGHAMKALNNFVGASGFAAASEALLVGRRFGLDPARMVEILNASTGRNFATEVILQEHVVDGKFASGFGLGLMAKDVCIAADLAHAMKLHAPLCQLVSQRFASARDELGASKDNTAAILSWDKDE